MAIETYKIKIDVETQTASIRDLKGQIVATKIPVKQLKQEFGNFAKTVNATQFKKFNQELQSTKGMVGGMKKMQRSTGGAATSVLELGRVVSDAPYGIRGMANNVSQLASNMLFGAQQIDNATGKAVGFNGVLKGMGKAFIGPLGILFAIQAVISAVDYFYGGMKKAEEITGKFTDLVDKQAGKLMLLDGIMKDSSVSLDDKKKIIAGVNEEFKDLNLTIDEQGQLTKKSQENIDKLTDSLVKNAKAQAVLGRITKEQSKIVEIDVERRKRIADAGLGVEDGSLEALEKMRQKYIDRAKAQIKRSNLTEEQAATSLSNYMKSDKMQQFAALKDFRKKDVEDAQKNIDELKKIITGESLFSIFQKKSKKGKLKILPTVEEFDKELEDYLAQLDKLSEKVALKDAENEQEAVEIKRKSHIKRLNEKQLEDVAKFTAQALAYAKEYKAFIDQQVRLEEMTEAEGMAAIKSSKSKADAEFLANEEGFAKILAGWQSFYDREAEQASSSDSKAASDGKLEKLMSYAKAAKKILEGIGDFIDSEFERELTIEQNKTTAINNQLQGRLLNESLSKDQRQVIQNQIAQNDEELRKKQEAIEKKRFKMQKAVDISSTIMDTAVAMMKAIKIYGPTPQGFVAAGLAAAQGAIQLAAISRQKFQNSSASSPAIASGSNGSSGAGDSSGPAFNIVGMGSNNQLLEAIQAQFDKPLKAYVVSREVTRQQNLDAAINTGASL